MKKTLLCICLALLGALLCGAACAQTFTFDAVHAPGFDITSKRYVSGTESFETPIRLAALREVTHSGKDMESSLLINDRDIRRLSHERDISVNGSTRGKIYANSNSYLGTDGAFHNVASLIYKRGR